MRLYKVPNLYWVLLLHSVFAFFWPGSLMAAPLEEITLSTATDKVVATIRLSGPVHNLRYFPAKKGKTLELLLEKLPNGLITEEWIDTEVLQSPPSNLIPSFTVKTNLKNIQPKLIVDFSREAEYTVYTGRDGRSILISIKIDKPLPVSDGTFPFLPEVKPLPATPSEVDKNAFALMQTGRNTLASEDNFGALDAFNKLLLLPPNDYTQDGQEWIGVSRERAGMPDKAKLEYELYLKLYPSSPGVNRVKLRLANLGSKPVVSSSATGERKEVKQRASQTLTYGSLSMHYYNGASKIETSDKVSQFGSALTKSTFSALDQSALLTNVYATERFISENYDNRIVFNDTAYTNFLPGQTNRNRLSTAYFELKNRPSDYSMRMGRQSSSGGGVLGRFDGVLAGFVLTPSIRAHAVAGQLSDYTIGSQPVFYGASVDMGPATIYIINQTIDSVQDRRAVGAEIRLFEPTKTAFMMVDYDTSYSVTNIAMLQATLNPTPERSYNLLMDYRKAPYISTRNALIGASTSNITDLTLFMTEQEIRALAAARTGTSKLAQIGVTQQISQKWQFGTDFRVSSFDDLPASGSTTLQGQLPATPGTGIDWAVSPQLIGSNLYSSRDVTVFSLSYMSNPIYKGQSFYIYSRANPTDKWSVDMIFQFFKQTYDSGLLMTRIMPTLRTAYQMKQNISFDLEAGVEKTTTETDIQRTDGQRQFYSLGFRWDF